MAKKPATKKRGRASGEAVEIAVPPTDAEMVRETVAWFVAGLDDTEVREKIAATWPAQNAQILIDAAFGEFAANSLRPQPKGEAPKIEDVVRGWAFCAYRSLYRKMLDTGNFPGACAAVKRIEDMVKR